MCIFVTVGVCVYACICVEMHGGVLLSVFLYLPAYMCTCSHLLVWMCVPLNVCVYVFLCTYMHSCLCISVSCMCIHVCVPMLTYICPCVYVYCLRACICICIFVCVSWVRRTNREHLLCWFPCLLSGYHRTVEKQDASLNWKNQSSPECSHPPTSSAQHSLPSMRHRASGLLPDGPCTSSSSGLQNPCVTPSPCQELHAFWGDRGTTVMCKAVFWLVLWPAWQETHGRSCNTRACSWGDNKALVRKSMLVFYYMDS